MKEEQWKPKRPTTLKEAVLEVKLIKQQLAISEKKVTDFIAQKHVSLFLALQDEIDEEGRKQTQFSQIYYVTGLSENREYLKAMRFTIKNFGEEHAESYGVTHAEIKLEALDKMVVPTDLHINHILSVLKRSAEIELFFMLRSAGWL